MAVVVCDSASDLYIDQLNELDIKVLNFTYIIDGVEYTKSFDKAEEYDVFYDKLKKGSLSNTRPLKRVYIEQYFDKLLLSGQDVLFIHMSNALTNSYNGILKLRDKLLVKYPERKFYIINSKTVTMAEGILAYHAAKLLKKGIPLEKIVQDIDALKDKIACYFGVKNLDYLKRDSKISNLINFGGSMLGVRPILKIDSVGKIVKVTASKGDKTFINKMVEQLVTTGDNAGDFPIIIVHADCERLASSLKQEIIKVVGEDSNVWIQPACAVIGSHCGPESIALIFRAKYR